MSHYTPLTKVHHAIDETTKEHGKQLVEAGKVGAIVLAGGQGTRLGIDAPKGTVAVTPVTKKSLFQLFAEKAGPFPIAFMTSPENHAATVSFFQKHDSFGLTENQLSFFQQTTRPLHTLEGIPTSVEAADGNGSLFWSFAKSGLLKNWEDAGIEYITVMVVDNALIDPFNSALIGLADTLKTDIALMAIERIDPTEKVGALALFDGKVGVIEYSEMKEEEKTALQSNGKPLFQFANISYFVFSIAFMKKMAALPIESMPLHQAIKKAPESLRKEHSQVLKSEYFIFDATQFAERVEVALFDRNLCFAPLKGPESFALIHKLLV